MLRRTAAAAVAVVLVATGLVLFIGGAAVADCYTDAQQVEHCTQSVTDQTQTPTQVSGPTGSSAPRKCYDGKKEVPCQTAWGSWTSQQKCYMLPLDPQPAAGDPAWKGHDPKDGKVYVCILNQVLAIIGNILNPVAMAAALAQYPPIFVPNGSFPPPPDPEQMAHDIAASIQFQPIQIGIVPEPKPGRLGLVGMPVWMWVDHPTDDTYGTVTETRAAGGVSVTVTATADHVEWDMGDGSSPVRCDRGTPYQDSYGKDDSPDCGYRYATTSSSQPGHAFTVTARTFWQVSWVGGGRNGTFDVAPTTATTHIRVGELQVLNQ